MVDNAVIDLLTSPDAEKSCSKMWLIYTRLKRADWQLWQRPGVLQLQGEGERTAWQLLCDLCGVASATLNKALRWMNEHRVIRYFSGKNGVGIRIYFNIPANSVKARDQKNLRLVPTSSGDARTSANEAPSCDTEGITKNIQNSEIRADARPVETPSAIENPPAPLPRLQLVPSPDLREVTAQIAEIKTEQRETRKILREVLAQVPDEKWFERQGAKNIRVAVSEALKVHQRETKTFRGAYVGASIPTQATAPDAVTSPPVKTQHSAFYAEKLGLIGKQINEESKETWFDPLQAEPDGNSVRILAPDSIFCDWIENNYADVLDDVGIINREWEFTRKEEL